jgi:hypothetical protein
MVSRYEFSNAKGIVQLVAPTENMLLVALTIEATARNRHAYDEPNAVTVTWTSNKVYRKEQVTQEKYEQLIRGIEVDVSSIPLENLDWRVKDTVIKDLSLCDMFVEADKQKIGDL